MVDLNYNFECDWLIELSDTKMPNIKLSDDNLASELVEKSITMDDAIAIFMIMLFKSLVIS